MIQSIERIIRSWEIDFEVILSKLIIATIVFLIFYFLGRIFRNIAYRINSKLLKNHPDLEKILSKIIYYFFLLIGCFLFLQIIGLEQYFTKILAGAGIVGIIAGFALKDIASNAFSGFLLFLEKPFKKGDWVQVDGHFGRVIRVGTLTTSLANRTGQEVFISNQLIYSGVFINYSIHSRRSIRIQAQAIQCEDLEEFKKTIITELSSITAILPETEVHFYIISLGENNSFIFELYFWVNFEEERAFLQIVDESVLIMRKISLEKNINIINTKWISDEDNTSSSGAYGMGG
jgi:small conductance mechanosensitive channel